MLGLLGNKTRIFATHGLNFLPHADRIVCLDNGTIAEQGSYDFLTQAGGSSAFKALMDTHGVKRKDDVADAATASETQPIISLDRADSMGGSRAGSLEVDVEKMKARAEAEAAKLKAGKLTTAEERDQGSVKWTTYADYLRFAGGIGTLIGLIFGYFGFQSCALLSEWYEQCLPLPLPRPCPFSPLPPTPRPLPPYPAPGPRCPRPPFHALPARPSLALLPRLPP